MIRRISILAFILALAFNVNAQNASDRYAAHSLLASGKWVKIRVSKEGVYEISKSKLASMGFSNPDKVSLYGYNLPVLPETKLESMDDDMTEIPLWRRSDGSVLFYSFGTVKWTQKSKYSTNFVRTNNTYSSYVYYFVTEKTTGTPAEMEKVTNAQTNTTPATTFAEHTLIDNDQYSFLNSGRTFYESYNYLNGNKKSYSLPLPGIADSKVNLTVQFAASGASASTVSVTANDTTFNSMSIKALGEYEYGVQTYRTFTWDNKLKEDNTITITHNRTSGVNGHLDYIMANYTRNLSLSNVNYLAFRPTYQTIISYQVSGANENTRVWDVTSPKKTYEVGGTYSDGKYIATIGTDTQLNEYVAVNTAASFPEPEVVGTIENQDLHALNNIDFVIIVPANDKLTTQAQRLADAHYLKDTTRCVVVRADQIYNEFSSGTPDITAYRRFMKMLYDKASTTNDRPKNVCLFGDCVWDNRMITSNLSKLDPDDYLLCYESENSLSNTDSYILEEYITLLADGKGVSPLKEKPDCGVGRIPVTTATEAYEVVNKLISYIENDYAGSWKNTICVMADDGNSNIHMIDAEEVCSAIEANYPNYRLRKIYWDSYTREESGAGHSYENAYKDITKQVEDGALIMDYTGHAGSYCLSHEQVIKRQDFADWTSPRIPLWFFAACDVTPIDRNEETIGETALLNSQGGALACITTTRTVYSAQNRKINVAFIKNVLDRDSDGRRYTIGEALAMAKSSIIAAGSMAKRDSLNKAHFILVGDPAITLATPTYKVKIDKFHNKTVPCTPTDTIGAGAIVNVVGHIEDEDGNKLPNFVGTVSPTIFDNLEYITCKNNAGDDVDPYQYWARVRTLYSGTDSVKNGSFEFSFPVPVDINYSNQSGLASLYAISNSKDIEANGSYTDFIVGGTDPDKSTDTNGPELTIALNGNIYTNKDSSGNIESNAQRVSDVVMNETPYFNGVIYDENGINTIGSGIGHDITLIIDNDPSMSYNLNSDFTYETSSWKKGSVNYSLPELSSGSHTLLFRAWDMLNNQSTLELTFNVEEGLKPEILDLNILGPVQDQLTVVVENNRPYSTLNTEIKIYDITGREVVKYSETSVSDENYVFSCDLSLTNGHLQPGIYICKASISTANGAKASKSKKFLVIPQ